VLERSQLVRLKPERAFAFFTDVRNLEQITPPWLAFDVVTPDAIQMRAGTLIDYRLKLHGLPMRWRTRIEVWEPPTRFVDVQLRGPYGAWAHTHAFEPADHASTAIGDRVRYALPLGVLGRLVHAAIVKRDLEEIFDYRERMVAELLQPT
jgi:ligand-binding SRPBCC domain-containing protein